MVISKAKKDESVPVSGKGEIVPREKLITFVVDRAGHGFGYAIDCSKIKRDLGFV